MNFSLRIFIFIFLASWMSKAQSDLTVNQIMQDPQWFGTFPSNIEWNEESDIIYFDYNPEQQVSDSLYQVRLKNKSNIEKVSHEERMSKIPAYGDYNDKQTQKLFVKSGDLYLYDKKKKSAQLILDLGERIQSPKVYNDFKICPLSQETTSSFMMLT